VYVNTDVTEPHPGCITINRVVIPMRVPIIYEDLHEVCPLYANEIHQLEVCPKLLTKKQIKVFVENFDAQRGSKAHKTIVVSSNSISN